MKTEKELKTEFKNLFHGCKKGRPGNKILRRMKKKRAQEIIKELRRKKK
jgi:hypothetical protein